MYYTTGTTILRVDEQGMGISVTARTEHVDKIIQGYLAGDLAAWQRPEQGLVRFCLPRARPQDPILLLAVDEADARRNFWAEATASQGVQRRIRVRMLRRMSHAPLDRWRVYLAAAGAASADQLVSDQPLYSGARCCGGWGFVWGEGGWGFAGSDAAGWGVNWGSEWGFGADALEWISPPLPRGTYPVKVTVADALGNESPAWQGAVTLNTPPRPAAGLAVAGYNRQSDTLTLTFTPSDDL